MQNSPIEESNQLDLDELVHQHTVLISPVYEMDDSLNLVQPHLYPYVPNKTTDAVLVENAVLEPISAQLE